MYRTLCRHFTVIPLWVELDRSHPHFCSEETETPNILLDLMNNCPRTPDPEMLDSTWDEIFREVLTSYVYYCVIGPPSQPLPLSHLLSPLNFRITVRGAELLFLIQKGQGS